MSASKLPQETTAGRSSGFRKPFELWAVIVGLRSVFLVPHGSRGSLVAQNAYASVAKCVRCAVDASIKPPLLRLTLLRPHIGQPFKLAFCRHYAELIWRFQREVQTELRRLAKESKEHEELRENLRDKIATQTVKNAQRVLAESHYWGGKPVVL